MGVRTGTRESTPEKTPPTLFGNLTLLLLLMLIMNTKEKLEVSFSTIKTVSHLLRKF